MPLIIWNERLSVGVREFDTQHQKLIQILNNLFDAMSQGQGKEILEKTLSELIEYTKIHFAAEERKMKAFNYPHYLSHKAEHDALADKVIELHHNFQTGKTVLSVSVMNFLKDWLNNHILKTDKLYAPLMNSKGF